MVTAPHIPGHRVGGVLGAGGFATVYRCWQLAVGREVAVKVDNRVLLTERWGRRRRGSGWISTGRLGRGRHPCTRQHRRERDLDHIVAGVSPPDDIRTRLRRALGDALKARDAGAVSALRSAMSAIGNAEAVDPGPLRTAGTGSAHFAGTVAGLGAGEAERRRLTEADVAAIVRQEAAEREAAAGEYERAGHAAEAARLREGAQALVAALEQGA